MNQEEWLKMCAKLKKRALKTLTDKEYARYEDLLLTDKVGEAHKFLVGIAHITPFERGMLRNYFESQEKGELE